MKRSQFSRTIVNNITEAYTWLKSLPGDLGLEKCSRVFESRGFVTLSSLKHLRPGDIDAFFPSPEKLLLAEKHVLESEIKGMIDQESRIIRQVFFAGCRLQVAGCRLKFHYNWKTAGTKKKGKAIDLP